MVPIVAALHAAFLPPRPRLARGACLLVLLALAAPTRATAPAAPPLPTATAATAPAPLRPGDTVAIEALLADLAFRTGILIVKADSIKGDVVVTEAFPEDPTKAVAILNEMLAPAGYRGIAVKNSTSTRLVLRILSDAEARREELLTGPVTLGDDPRKIDVRERDRMVTHILPLKHPDLLEPARRAAEQEKSVQLTVSGNAESGYRLILAGPAATVRRLAETVLALDPVQPADATIFRSIQLRNLDAEGSAAVLVKTYGQDAAGNPVITAIADKRTNTIILRGPDLQVFQAIQLLQRMDATAAPPPASPLPAVPPPAPLPPVPPPTPANPATRPGAAAPAPWLDEIASSPDNAPTSATPTASPPRDAIGGADLPRDQAIALRARSVRQKIAARQLASNSAALPSCCVLHALSIRPSKESSCTRWLADRAPSPSPPC